MASLAEKISELFTPVPASTSFDPEDNFHVDDTSTKLLKHKGDDDDDDDEHEAPPDRSLLRQKNALALSESDPRYAGKSVSRRQIEDDNGLLQTWSNYFKSTKTGEHLIFSLHYDQALHVKRTNLFHSILVNCN